MNLKRIKICFCLFVFFLFSINGSYSQDRTSLSYSGNLQLGLRASSSLFSSTSHFGQGIGGQFRLRLLNSINTDWFADYFIEDLNRMGRRTDAHIGWNVIFYLNSQNPKWQAFLIAGHCFDYTRINTFGVPELNIISNQKERWSSAVQAGIGVQWNVSEMVNLTVQSQYMLHLGNDLHVDEHKILDVRYLEIESTKHHASLEGHLLITFGMNVNIADLW